MIITLSIGSMIIILLIESEIIKLLIGKNDYHVSTKIVIITLSNKVINR